MPEYSTDVTSRDESAEETAVLLVALAGKVRQKIAAKLGGTLPSDPSEIFQASWWDDEINAAIDDHLTAVAASAASAAHEGIGLGEIDADERDDIAGYVAAAVALMLLSRSEVVTGRVTDVLESALAEGKSPERVARELGVTEDDESGPLSAALMTAIGVSAGLALIDMATGETVDRALAAGKVTGTKTWWAVGDDRTRPSHRTASGQEVPLDAMFDVGGFEGPFPHSPLLPVHETAGCRCWLTYQVDTVAAGETGSGDVDGLELDEVEDVLGVAASAAATLEDRMKPKTATAETSADMPADPPSMEPEGEPPADLGSVPDDVLSDELARRLAETVIAESQTDGSEVSADEAAVIFEAASDAVAVALAEAHDALEAAEPVEETEPVEDADDSGEPVTDDGMMMAARELVAELRSSSSFAASFVLSGNVDLPIAERDRPWDGNDAVQRMELRASSDGTGDPATIDWTVFADGFLWHEENPSTVGAFKLPFCDVIDGELKIVPAGVFAVAQRLDQTDIPDGDKTEVKGRLSTLYEKIAAKYDDDKLVTPFAVNQDRYMGRPFAFDGYPPAPANVEPDGEGILCVEGVPSDDGRLIAEGALDWRQLPLPMTFINRITERHQDAEFCGWWTSIERRGQAIWGEFVLADNPAAEELRSYMADPRGPGRFGVSADIGGTKIVYATSDGSILSPPEAQEAYWSGEEITEMMIEGVCLGGTGVAHPAFADAQIWLIESNRAETAEALVASGGARTVWSTFRSDSLVPYGAGQGLVASAAGPDPDAPHSSWFEMRPGPVPPFMVFPDGRCFGLACTWEDVHIGLPKTTKPPKLRDVTNFYGAPAWTEFYTGDVLKRFYVDGKYVLTSDGKMVEVGPLILDNVHPDLRRNASDSQAFYASTGAAVADVRVHFTNQGIVLAGAMRPTATTTDARILRASSISPDWRPIDGKLRLIAFLAVNVSAFQMEGLAASAGRAGTYCEVDETTGEVLALVATGGCASRERTLAETVEFLLVRQAQMETELAEARRFVAREKAREALELLDIGGLRRRRVVEARSALVTLGLASPDPEAVAALRVLASEPAAA